MRSIFAYDISDTDFEKSDISFFVRGKRPNGLVTKNKPVRGFGTLIVPSGVKGISHFFLCQTNFDVFFIFSKFSKIPKNPKFSKS